MQALNGGYKALKLRTSSTVLVPGLVHTSQMEWVSLMTGGASGPKGKRLPQRQHCGYVLLVVVTIGAMSNVVLVPSHSVCT
jgi:hypothetical protein